ncbi:MAG: hypothetical protein WCP52_10290 [Bacteroidota bacterium]
MNRVKSTANGGFPVVLNDLRFNEQATRDAFYGLLSAFGINTPDCFILSGCQLISGVWQEGWVAINNEILKFDSCSYVAPATGYLLCWDLDISYDSAGNKVFRDGSSVQTYEVRKAKIVPISVSGLTGYTLVSDTLTLAKCLVNDIYGDIAANLFLSSFVGDNLLSRFAGLVQENWHVVGSGGSEPAYTSGFAAMGGGNQLRFMKNTMGDVRIQGVFVATASLSGLAQVFIPPITHQAGTEARIDFAIYDITDNTWGRVSWVNGGGLLGIYIDSPISGHGYSIGSISYRAV